MIHFDPAIEPADFDAQVRQPGLNWLNNHASATSRPPNYWTRVQVELREAFRGLCAYGAIYEPLGVTDHFVDISANRSMAYKWSNYRFSSHLMNSFKNARKTEVREVLDPFEVGDDWFEIHIPSMQLLISTSMPQAFKEQAEFTLKRLHLVDDERIVKCRREWYDLYLQREISLDTLCKYAPLVAKAAVRHGL